MDEVNEPRCDDDAATEDDPGWRERTQETNEQAERLATPQPSGSEEEGTPLHESSP